MIADHHQAGAEEVDPVRLTAERELQDGRGHDEGHDADGKVDVEDPPPRQVFGEHPAEQRPGDRGQGEGGSEVALVAAPLPGRDDVGDDRHGHGHEPAGPQALDAPEGDQLAHVLAESGQCRADQEDHDGELEDALAPELVGQLAVERGGDGRRQQVGGHHPAHVVETVEAVDDGRQRGADDGLVEGGQEHAEHQAAEDDQDLAVAEGHHRAPARRRVHLGCTGQGRVLVVDSVRVTLRCGVDGHRVPSSVSSCWRRRSVCASAACASRRCWRSAPRRVSPLARALRSSSRPVGDGLGQYLAPRLRHRLQDGHPPVGQTEQGRPSVGRVRGPGDESGDHQVADLAADGRQVEFDRPGQVGESERRLFGHQDQQPVAGLADGHAVGQGVAGARPGGGWSARPGSTPARARPRRAPAWRREAVGGVDGRRGHGGPGGDRGRGVAACRPTRDLGACSKQLYHWHTQLPTAQLATHSR